MQSQLDLPLTGAPELTEPFVKRKQEQVKEPQTLEVKEKTSKSQAFKTETVNNNLIDKLSDNLNVTNQRVSSLDKKVQRHSNLLEDIQGELDYFREVDKKNQRQIMDNDVFQNNLGYLNQLSSDLKRCEDQNKSLRNTQETLYKRLRDTLSEVDTLRSENKVCYIVAGLSIVISLVSVFLKIF